jgi:hypothetical protein
METTMSDEQRKRMLQQLVQIAKLPSPREDYKLVAAPPLTDEERSMKIKVFNVSRGWTEAEVSDIGQDEHAVDWLRKIGCDGNLDQSSDRGEKNKRPGSSPGLCAC